MIAGLGDSGLLSAIQLNKKFEVIGISPKPCLVSGQELGPRLARPKDWEENYLIDYDRFKGLKGVDIRHAKVSEIISDENKIGLIGYDGSRETLAYDVLVISSGNHNPFPNHLSFCLKPRNNRRYFFHMLVISGTVFLTSVINKRYADKKEHCSYRNPAWHNPPPALWMCREPKQH